MNAVTAALDFVQTYNGAFTAASTFAIFLATLASAYIAAKLAAENRILRKAGTEPHVIAYLLPDERHPAILNMVIKNIGKGPAIGLKFTLEADEADLKAH